MGYKVLIVEDSTASREFIASTIEQIDGAEVVCAGSGFDALKLLPRFRFDLIITDINMPDINGLELINFVKMNPNYRETPLIIVTGGGPAARPRPRVEARRLRVPDQARCSPTT